MKHTTELYHRLCQERDFHKDKVFNYTIPESWDLYGYQNKRTTKQKECIVNPYEFTLFTLDNILSTPAASLKKDQWFKESVLYYQVTRLTTAWDHDRTSSLEKENLYQLNDHGTFLKAILRLPFYRRMGINTILLSSPFLLQTGKKHEFANANAIYSFQEIDETLADPILQDMPVEDQYLAFEECAHHLGFHIIWQVDFATLARDNAYKKEHPEWFYWVKKESIYHLRALEIPYLSKNCLPELELKELILQSEDYQIQKEYYIEQPIKKEIDQTSITPIPFLHDRINSTLPIEYDYTPLRFYLDSWICSPLTLRCDLYEGKEKNTSLWNMILNTLKQIQESYQVDGFYFTRPYLYPEKLLHKMVQQVKNYNQVVILEEVKNQFQETNKLAYDAISGDSAYVEYDVWNHQLHNFAYRLKDNPYPVFAAAEFLDTLRIPQYNSPVLTSMLHVLNLFLPNANPLYISGMECMDEQPLCLSYFQDQSLKNALSPVDNRFQKIPLLDSYYFEYRNNGMYMLPKLLEQCAKIRQTYIQAITDKSKCTPLWFHSPNDPGIGFAYSNNDSILLVVTNTDIRQAQTLAIHIDTVFLNEEKPFHVLQQIFSTYDPFVYDLDLHESHVVTAHFQPGEIKFFELTK